jgi:methionine-rich copper-binding protein CopC
MSNSRQALRIAIVGALLWVGSARAHAAYLRSAPGENSVVSAPPARVDIWFTQELFRRQGENQIQVFGAGEQPVHAGDAQVDDDDRTHLWVELLPGLAPGTYRVEWRSLSAEDGDSDQGMFSFTLDPQAEATSTPMGAAGPGAATDVTGAGQATAPPANASPAPTQAQAQQATQSEPGTEGSRCLAGLVPVAGLIASAWILRGRLVFSR